jgi:hypothetical protein
MSNRKCRICGNFFYIKPAHLKLGWGKYCSIKCRNKSQLKGKWVKCDNCGKKIWRTPKDFNRSKNKKFFCSVACHCSWENYQIRCGAKSPNWKTGVSAYRDLLRRHNIPYKCSRCGFSDKRALVVHHKDSNRNNNLLSNLERICCNCHAIIHAK